MIIKTNVNGISKAFDKIIKQGYKDIRAKQIIPALAEAVDILRDEVLKTIKDYNSGKIERFSGDYSKRLADAQLFGRNLPLIDTSEYYKSISNEIGKQSLDEIIGKVYSDTAYAHKIEIGDIKNGYEPFRVFEIALMNCRYKIIEAFKKKR